MKMSHGGAAEAAAVDLHEVTVQEAGLEGEPPHPDMVGPVKPPPSVFFAWVLGRGRFLIVPAPRPSSRLGDVRAPSALCLLMSWLSSEGIPLEKAKGTGRVERRYDG